MRVTKMSAFSTGANNRTNKPMQGLPQAQAQAQAQAESISFTGKIGEILSGFEKDDYILAGIIAVLIWEGCDDYILLAALGYLFIMGLKN